MPTVGVFAAIFDDQGRILLVRRNHGPQNWTTPGGRLDPFESPFEALRAHVVAKDGEPDSREIAEMRFFAQDELPEIRARTLRRVLDAFNSAAGVMRVFAIDDIDQIMEPVRRAKAGDIPRMADLAEQKRIRYERFQSVFWRRAMNARERQIPYLTSLLERADIIALVHPAEGKVDGFIIGTLHEAPPVYDPGGLTCSVDDFVVADPGLWPSAGRRLLDALISDARGRGAVQIVVVCGRLDTPKQAMLHTAGMNIASEWFVMPLRGTDERGGGGG